jgi:hypothetical protein
MDSTKKAYRIGVLSDNGESKALLICVSYPLDESTSSYGIDFYELECSKSFPSENIPSSRQSTFKEELRARNRASVARDFVENEKDFIAKKMKNVYGQSCSVTVSDI